MKDLFVFFGNIHELKSIGIVGAGVGIARQDNFKLGFILASAFSFDKVVRGKRERFGDTSNRISPRDLFVHLNNNFSIVVADSSWQEGNRDLDDIKTSNAEFGLFEEDIKGFFIFF